MHETVGKIRVLENSNFNLLGRMQGNRTETIFAENIAFLKVPPKSAVFRGTLMKRIGSPPCSSPAVSCDSSAG